MLDVSESSLVAKNEELKSHLEYYNLLGKPLVEEYTKELDEKVNAVKSYLNQIKEFDLGFDVLSLQKIVIDLSSTIYFTQEQVEKLGVLEDMSKIKYKKAYNCMLKIEKFLEVDMSNKKGAKDKNATCVFGRR